MAEQIKNQAGSASTDELPSLNVSQQIDAICKEFLRAVSGGQPPTIEEYLVRLSGEARPLLFAALIAEEIELRRAAGEIVHADDYAARFPAFCELVSKAFEQHRQIADSTVNRSRVDEDSVESPIDPIDLPLPKKFGRYVVVRRIGKGGFGVVYLGSDPELCRDVALKVPRPDRFLSEEDRERFLEEARTAARLSHSGIVASYDVVREGNTFCVVQEYVDGPDLSQWLTQKAKLVEPNRAAILIAEIAEIVSYAHEQGFVHRDLKPSNVLLDHRNRPRVADFGLALHESARRGSAGDRSGTPAYMSPEQVRGESHRLDGRSDIWSLGVMLYEMLTGRKPFNGRTYDELYDEILHSEPKPPRQFNPNLPAELERVCLRCLSKRMADRYTTATDLAKELRCWQDAPVAGPRTVPNEAPTLLLKSLPVNSISVVPKGLRSFDENDADFFLELLPGPRGRDGLPESIRFWKSRLESIDVDQTFAVGLLYGPSGCGKSSLMKAGLIPRLSNHVVRVYLEATAEEIEMRALRALRRQLPAIPAAVSFPRVLAGLREGQWMPQGKKVVFVLDQFEQWLHACGGAMKGSLIDALRQCDGARVQCLVMVRDDFWMAATRFMRELEVRLVEGHNSAAVDLFDTDHAAQVLAAFGRAFGKLPKDSASTSPEQMAFLREAISGLAQEGKVVSVRLSLFAEMIKSKLWVPSTLKTVGGAKGVGVTFLGETFSSATAPPEHRLHQKAARAVLKTLLPESGADIKGHMRSESELLSASGYDTRPRDFTELLRILDSELRLITPTDPEGQATADGVQSAAPTGPKQYQLTHDYLVPSLREWLTRKQKETRRGRAELRLEERSALWNAKPENRYLPALWELLNIRLFTSARSWTAPQRTMMRRATTHHAMRGVLLATALLVVTASGFFVRRQLAEQTNASYAAGLVRQLLRADIAQVPEIIEEISRNREWIDPLLQDEFARTAPASSQQLHVALALVPSDPTHVPYLVARLLKADASEVPVIRDGLAPHKSGLLEELWVAVEQAADGKEAQRLRAACALASFDPESARWEQVCRDIVEQLVAENPASLQLWMDGFRPVRGKLLPALAAAFRNQSDQYAARRNSATRVLVEYAADEPELLADLLMDADEKQFAALFPRIIQSGERGQARLSAELDNVARPRWSDQPLDPSWSAPDPYLVRRIEKAEGMIHDRFAFCQAMPLEELLEVIEALRPSGYRPIRFRPYQHGETTAAEIWVSALWARDGQDWQLAHNLTAQEMERRDAAASEEHFCPIDVCGYLGEAEPRFAAVWHRDPMKSGLTEMAVNVDARGLEQKIAALSKSGYRRTAFTSLTEPAGRTGYSAIWSGSLGGNNSGANDPADAYPSMAEAVYASGELVLTTDVHVSLTSPGPDAEARGNATLGMAEARLKQDPNNANDRLMLARAYLELSENEKALETFTWMTDNLPGEPKQETYFHRALTLARLGRIAEAKQDSAQYQKLNTSEMQKAYLDAVISSYAGEDTDGLKRLEEGLAKSAEKANYLLAAARAYSVSSQALAIKQPQKAASYANRCIELLKELFALGDANRNRLFGERDFDAIRDHPEYHALRRNAKLDRRYAGVHLPPEAGLSSTRLQDLEASEHLEQCKRLVEEGYRPVSLSVASLPGIQTSPQLPSLLISTSAWHRPTVSELEREKVAKRQANAAVALMKLDRAQQVWPLLKLSPDPRVRNYLVHRFRPLGIDPALLVSRLDEEMDDSIRRALIVSLGEFDKAAIGSAKQEKLLSLLMRLYEGDPDPGVHSSIAWLLGRWGLQKNVHAIDEKLAAAGTKLTTELRWFVNSQGQPFAVIPGPMEFRMGSPHTEVGRDKSTIGTESEILHTRRIGRSFAIGMHEVSVAQFLRFKPDHYRFNRRPAPIPDCPIDGVRFDEAAEYCNWLSQVEGLPKEEWCYEANANRQAYPRITIKPGHLKLAGYRLPTDGEWEYACRSGTLTARYFGETDELLGKYAWTGKRTTDTQSIPVGTLKPNDFGMFDMLGNLAEISVPGADTFLRPTEKSVEDTELKDPRFVREVYRGGSSTDSTETVRSARRGYSSRSNMGFRVAKTYDKSLSRRSDSLQLAREQASGYHDRGVRAVELGDFDQAIVDFSKSLELNPDNAIGFFNRGKARLERKAYDQAIADLSEALRLNPQHTAAIYNRGRAWYDKGDYEKALADLTDVLSVEPQNVAAFLYRGNARRMLKDYDQAIADYTEALRLNPKYTSAYMNRGNVWRDKKDFDQALADYNEAIRLEPKNAVALGNRGNIWRDKKDDDRAIADYNESLRLNPNNPTVLYSRGASWLSKNDYDKAIANFTEAIRLNPKYHSAYHGRGFAWSSKKDYDKAIADYSEALRLSPTAVVTYNNRGGAWNNKKEHDKALADYNEALRIDPTYLFAYVNRGNLWRDKQEYDRAIEDYNEALRLDPKHVSAWVGRGSAWVGKKNDENAINDFNEALQLDPQNATAYYGRGNAWRSKSEYDHAIADYSEALKINPKYAAAMSNRGVARKQKGDYDSALADFEQAKILDPNLASVYNLQAWLRATCPDAKYRDGMLAVENATKACELTNWKNASYLDTLAASFAEAKDFPKAIESLEKALQLATEPKQAEFHARLEQRLELYQAGQPFRDKN